MPMRRQRAEGAAAFDSQLTAFLRAVRPHVLRRGGLRALEFLLRVRSAHVHTPEAVLQAALPYHGTRVYARARSLVQLQPDSPWRWLPPRLGCGPHCGWGCGLASLADGRSLPPAGGREKRTLDDQAKQSANG